MTNDIIKQLGAIGDNEVHPLILSDITLTDNARITIGDAVKDMALNLGVTTRTLITAMHDTASMCYTMPSRTLWFVFVVDGMELNVAIPDGHWEFVVPNVKMN